MGRMPQGQEEGDGALRREDDESALRWRVLRSFGAVPLTVASDPQGRLGRLAGTRTLVMARLPHEPVGVGELLELLSLLDALPGCHDRAVVLGWHFVRSIHDDLRGLNDPRLFLMRVAVPASRLPTVGLLHFAPLRRLKVEAGVAGAGDLSGRQVLSLILCDYAVPPGMGAEGSERPGLSRLRWWAVDPRHDGVHWCPTWESAPLAEACAPPPLSVWMEVPVVAGARQVCVRALDEDGVESQAVLAVLGPMPPASAGR